MATADHYPADPELAWQLLMAGAVMRQGRSVGRTLYLQVGPDPSKNDLLVGMMDSPSLAAYVAHAVNQRRQAPQPAPQVDGPSW